MIIAIIRTKMIKLILIILIIIITWEVSIIVEIRVGVLKWKAGEL